MNFTSGEDAYTVTRKITREQGTTARLEKNGAYMQAQPETGQRGGEQLLNVDYDTFSRVVYSEQNRLDYFLELPKGDRKRQIDQMLGLDRFANAEVNATSLINSHEIADKRRGADAHADRRRRIQEAAGGLVEGEGNDREGAGSAWARRSRSPERAWRSAKRSIRTSSWGTRRE